MKIMHRQRPFERNVLRIVILYSRMRENPHLEVTPRAFFALTLGRRDGATIEMAEGAREGHFFLCGLNGGTGG